jgi:TolB-like protein
MPLSAGRKFGPYEIVAPIGAGGMGEVYRAMDTKLGRDVALKILPAEMAQDPDRLARFQREARAVAALNHPNVVTLHSVEECDGVHFLTMELVEGQSLDQIIPKDGFAADRIIDMASALAEALAAAHDKGLVHRDLKPANIMVTNDGRIKVLDFGLAKDVRTAGPTEATATSVGQTQMGVVMGTPPYMSPEQISGRVLDHRSDIFSLGIILHEMTTGRRPFEGNTSAELAASILRDNPPPVTSTRTDLPDALASLIQQCLAKDAGERIQSARLLAKGIQQARLQLASGTTGLKTVPLPTADEGFWVAVLPFKYRGGNVEFEALADGLSEEIVTGLSRFSYLRVIARGSTLGFTQEHIDVRAAGQELGARYVMKGSLRQAGSRLRVAVHLSDTTTGAHLWAETYDRPFVADDVFALQDDLVSKIVSTVADQHGVLLHSMGNLIRNKSDQQLSPHEAVLRVFGFHERMSPEEHASIRALLERIVENAPGEGDCWAMLATIYSDEYMFGFSGKPDPLGRARAAAQRAVEIAPSNWLACQALAQSLFFRRELQAFRPVAERAIVLNRMDGASTAFIGMLLALAGDWERGCAETDRAIQLNPHHPGWYWLATVFNAYRKRDYRTSVDAALRINMPGYFWGPATSAAAFGQLGDREGAQKAVKELLSIRPDFATAAREEFGKWFAQELVEHYLEGLSKAGLEIGGAVTQALSPSGETRADEGFWVAVLPFKSAGPSAELTALAEGLSDEIVTGLSRFSYLRVIARGSTLRYAQQTTDLRTVGKELGARYVMEGSLRQAGPKLRVAVQLVDAATGAHLWAETYERAFHPEAIFEVQDDLVPRIVSTVADHEGVLPQSMAEVLRGKSEDQLSPHEAMLRSFRFFKTLNLEEHAVAKRVLERAVRSAPNHGECWALLSHMYSNDYWHAPEALPEFLDLALAAARRAVDSAPSSNLSYWALALALYLKRDFPAFHQAAARAIELNRMDGSTVAFMGGLIAYSGEWERGSAIAEPASALNSNHAGWHWLQVFIFAYHKRDFQGALAAALKANMPDNYLDPAARAAAYGELGDRELAQKSVQELLALEPDFASKARDYYGRWQSPELVELQIESWRKAGLEIEGGAASSHSPSGEARADEGFWVAVLPFKSTGASAELAALAEGLSEEIVTGLSRFSYLRVIARGSTLKYAGQATDLRTVGKELGARYVMEGSLRQSGAKLRVAVQLVDAQTGAQLWAETYERVLNSDAIFELQDDLVPRIVSTVADQHGVLPHSMSAVVRAKNAEQLSPYEAVLRTFSYFERLTPEEHAEVRRILEAEVREAPDQSDCWAMLSMLYRGEYALGFNPQPDSLGRAHAAAHRAVETAPSNSLGHYALAATLFFQKDLHAFRSAAEHAIALNPMDGSSIAFMGTLIAFSGDWDPGCAMVERARQLNPHHAGWYNFAACFNAYNKGEYRAALDAAYKIKMMGYYLTFVARAAALGQLGEHELGRTAVKELLALRPSIAKSAREDLGKWLGPELVEHVIDGLRKAGLAIESATVPARIPSGETRTEEGFWVAVLPFKSAGTSVELAALAEGLSEQIVTGLSRFSYLRVIGRGSTLRYANQTTDLRTIGKELGARYVMEGSLRQAGPTLRVAVQLVDTTTGAHLWAETYDRPFHPDELFKLQDDLVPRIVSTVADQQGILPHSMSEALRSKESAKLTPHEAVLRAFSYFERITPEEHAEVRQILEDAAKSAPGHSDCQAMLSIMYWHEYAHEFNVRPDPLGRALEASRRAIKAAPANHTAHYTLAATLFFQRDLLAFRPAAEHAISLNRMAGATTAFMGILTAYSGDWERGCAIVEQASQLNPHHPGWYNFAAFFNAYNKGEYRAAVDAAFKVDMPGYFYTFVAQAAALGQLGEGESARKALRELLALRPDFATAAREEFVKWYPPELVERLLDGLRKAGLEITSDSQPALPGQLAQTSGTSIAVLPFANLSADPDQEYFSDGLAEEIINVLAHIPGLRVIARTSAFAFKGQNSDIRHIAETLGVAHVLEGSVRRSGNRIRVTAQLITARDGSHLWSERFDREMADVFEVQDEIAAAIAKALHIKLSRQLAALRKYTPNAPAYDAMMRARHHFNKLTPESMERGRQCLEEAIALDPGYALAYSELGVHIATFAAAGTRPAHEVIPSARAAIQKALGIDSSLPEALAALGRITALYDYDWVQGERLFNLALAHTPPSPTVRKLYSLYLLAIGQPRRGIEELELALREDPLDFYFRLMLALALLMEGDRAAAISECRRVLEFDEHASMANLVLIFVHFELGDVNEAVHAAETAHISGAFHWAVSGSLAGLLKRRGETERASTILQTMGDGTAYGAPAGFLCYHLISGEVDQAADWAEKAIEQRQPSIVLYLRLPFARDLRSSARWPALARLMNLPDKGE